MTNQMATRKTSLHACVGIPVRMLGSCGAEVPIALALLAAGCSQQMPDRTERMTRGYVYYLDGAGEESSRCGRDGLRSRVSWRAWSAGG